MRAGCWISAPPTSQVSLFLHIANVTLLYWDKTVACFYFKRKRFFLYYLGSSASSSSKPAWFQEPGRRFRGRLLASAAAVAGWGFGVAGRRSGASPPAAGGSTGGRRRRQRSRCSALAPAARSRRSASAAAAARCSYQPCICSSACCAAASTAAAASQRRLYAFFNFLPWRLDRLLACARNPVRPRRGRRTRLCPMVPPPTGRWQRRGFAGGAAIDQAGLDAGRGTGASMTCTAPVDACTESKLPTQSTSHSCT